MGRAYAVLPYVAQHAVKTHHWLAAGQMLDGLGLAETDPPVPARPPYLLYPYASIGLLHKSKVIFTIHNDPYYDFYVKLLTGPVPVQFRSVGHDFQDD